MDSRASSLLVVCGPAAYHPVLVMAAEGLVINTTNIRIILPEHFIWAQMVMTTIVI